MKLISPLLIVSLAAPASAQLAYGIDNHGPFFGQGDRLVSFDLSSPQQVTVIGHTGADDDYIFTGLDFDAAGDLYGYAVEQVGSTTVARGLYSIDTQTGAATFIGVGGLIGSDSINDLTYDHSSGLMYGIGNVPFGNNSVRLYRINLSTGIATLDRTITNVPFQLIVGLASDAQGRIFTHDITTDAVFEVIGTLVNFLGNQMTINTIFSQGMTFDPNTGTWYLAAWVDFIDRAQLHIIDKSNGLNTLVGSIGPLSTQLNKGLYELGDIAIPTLAEVGTAYCNPAVVNSTGVPAVISALGSDVVAQQSFLLKATELPPNKFGYFLASEGQALIANPGGSQGNLCLAQPLGRFAAQIQNSEANGEISIPVDLSAIPLLGTVMPGDTFNFQCWYRDNNPGSTSNFSDAVSVNFQ